MLDVEGLERRVHRSRGLWLQWVFVPDDQSQGNGIAWFAVKEPPEAQVPPAFAFVMEPVLWLGVLALVLS